MLEVVEGRLIALALQHQGLVVLVAVAMLLLMVLPLARLAQQTVEVVVAAATITHLEVLKMLVLAVPVLLLSS
jgi:hypothetical protein